MTPANPIACSYCGGRHGHSIWCDSFAERWRQSITIVDGLVEKLPPGRERGRARSKLMHLLCEMVRANENEPTKQAFADAMYAAGYNRPW